MGPRLLANGPEITVTGGLGDTNALHLPYDESPTFCLIANGPDEIRRAVRTFAREGVDLLKLNISGDGGTSSAGADVTMMTDTEVDAAMEQARKAGATIVKPAHDTFWGGYSGYFQDPDGHLWEVAWNPQWRIPE